MQLSKKQLDKLLRFVEKYREFSFNYIIEEDFLAIAMFIGGDRFAEKIKHKQIFDNLMDAVEETIFIEYTAKKLCSNCKNAKWHDFGCIYLDNRKSFDCKFADGVIDKCKNYKK